MSTTGDCVVSISLLIEVRNGEHERLPLDPSTFRVGSNPSVHNPHPLGLIEEADRERERQRGRERGGGRERGERERGERREVTEGLN